MVLGRSVPNSKFFVMNMAHSTHLFAFLLLVFSTAVEAQNCNETAAAKCDRLAYCTVEASGPVCECPEGVFGNGLWCRTEAFVVRTVVWIDTSTVPNDVKDQLTIRYARMLIAGDPLYDHAELDLDDEIAKHAVVHVSPVPEGGAVYTFNALFENRQSAIDARLAMTNDDERTREDLLATWLMAGWVGEMKTMPKVYAWSTGTTSNPFEVGASGMALLDIEFDSTCKNSGCWVIQVQYATQPGSTNVFYLPKVSEDDKTGEDTQTYDGIWQYRQNVLNQYEVRRFPCGTQQYSETSGTLPRFATACCMPQIVDSYRPVDKFAEWLNTSAVKAEMDACQTPWADNSPIYSEAPTAAGLEGGFPGMETSHVEYTGTLDYYANIHIATFYLDEVEMRTSAGMVAGTVGVEYIVDSFVGMVSFAPTGLAFLDSFAVQTRIHVEKTNFFTVSTWGYYGPVPVGREDNCYGPECVNDFCDPLDNCCQGFACLNCTGSDCGEAICIGPVCCIGPECVEEQCADGDNCCIGEECAGCVGPECSSSTCGGTRCCVGPDCAGEDCPDGGNCCEGDSCGECLGPDCKSPGCAGENCCMGEECCRDGTFAGGACNIGECHGSNCCDGPDCDNCVGLNCLPRECLGDDCCKGRLCSDDDAPQCSGSAGDCCFGPECDNCIGDDCIPAPCTGADCCQGDGCTDEGMCSGIGDCCVGDGCGECVGADCTPSSCAGAECCMGTGCNEDGTCTPGFDESCCVGEDCNTQTCADGMTSCCQGPDCVFNAETGGVCPAGENCCAGADCDTCKGPDCRFSCTGPDCCVGTGCSDDGNCIGDAGSGTCCTSTSSGGGTAAHWGACNSCVGEDCGSSQCVGADCCMGEDCSPGTSGPECSGPNCCLGLHCNECFGRDCEAPKCMGDACCIGPSCNTLSGACTARDEPGASCCVGLACQDDCYGPDCLPKECVGENCCYGENCEWDGSPSDPPTCGAAGDMDNCCFGLNCSGCVGPHCTAPTCEGDECCKGPDCLPDGSCPADGNCCSGPDCDGCWGVDCAPPPCYGSDCCYGKDCLRNGTCPSGGDCCVGDGCDMCVGECCEGFCPGEGGEDSVIQGINPRIHQVSLDSRSDGSQADSKMQYVSLTMTVGEQFDANPRGGAIPVRGVLSGKGERYSQVDLQQACSDLYVGDTKAKFEEALDLDCAPAARMCEAIYSIPDQALIFNIPLGDSWFSIDGETVDTSLTADFKIFVDTIVSLVDKSSGSKAYAQVLAEVPLVSGGVARWCEEQSAKVDLVEVAGAHLLVGTVGLDSEFDRLRKWYDVQSSVISPQDPTNIDTDSIESGLMTLILYGDDAYFGSNRSRSSTFSLELEDVITVHIMEEFDTMYQWVMDLVNADDAFDVTFDRWGLHAHLDPTSNLSAICPFFPRMPSTSDPFPATCVTRRDRKRRENILTNLIPTVMELTEGDETKEAAGEYMQSILGASDYTRDLGQNFSQIIRARFGINDQYNRAFWINPGYQWMPQTFGTRFTISQRLIMFCLINLDEGLDVAVGGPNGRRAHRQVLVSERRTERRTTTLDNANNELSSFNLKFGIDQFQMYMDYLGADESRVSMWSITTQLTDEQACLTTDELKAALRVAFKGYLDDVSDDVEDLHISEVVVQGAETVDCSDVVRRRRLLKFNADVTADVTTMVVFKEMEGAAPFIDVNELRQQPGILVAKPERMVVCPDDPDAATEGCVRLDSVTTQEVKDGRGSNGGLNWDTQDADGEGSGSAMVGIICGVVGGLAAVVLCGAVVWWKKKRIDEVLEVEAVYHSKDPMAALKDEISADVCVDAFGNFEDPTFKPKSTAGAVVEARGSESNSSGGGQLNWEDKEELARELRGDGPTRGSSEALLNRKDFGAC